MPDHNPTAAKNTEQRLINLETQLAHQQHICDQLNEVIIEQSKRMVRIERIILQLENHLGDLQRVTRESRDVLDEKPPHY
jgi:SlyX protein